MPLWWEWFRCVQALRPACARHRTFVWLSLVLAGLSSRADLAGVSSFVRALGLEAKYYRRLLYLFHTRALALEMLTGCWTRLVLKLFTPLRVGKRLVLVGDGLKVAKEGKKMPAVKKLHQSSDNNSKPSYIWGHSFQALGLLIRGPLGHLCCVPLTSRIQEGVVFSNRDRRTLLDKFVQLFLTLVGELEGATLLVVDAYYASRKVVRPLLAVGHHVLTRVRRNAVAYVLAEQPAKRRRGRPQLYGEKVHLHDLWQSRPEQFHTVPSPIYGETCVMLRYYAVDLLWRPVGQLVRFVLVEHPTRGRLMLMSSDLTLTPLELITCYGYRFKIEVAFKQALYTLGSYAYHFWMMAMTPLSRRSGNQYLHRKAEDYRHQVRRKLAAYHRYVQLGCIAQGLLQYLALYFRADVWTYFRSWLRTMKPAQPPSEAVVAQALRNTLPEFLVTAPAEHDLKKFILERTDFDRCPELQLAA
jgi:DDE superfamily endonuclease